MRTQKFKVATAILLALIVIIIISCKTKFDTTKNSFTATKSPEALERGKVLAYSICAGCHYDRSVHKFIGTQIHEIPGIIGKVYSANLTRSKTHGIPPHYSDAEIKYLLKTGVAKDGRFLNYMLRPNMSDEDINAIIVYLRSDDPAVAATDTTIGLTHFNLIGKTVMGAMAKPIPYKDGIKTPAESDAITTGKYLVDNLGCFHCHSKSLKSLDLTVPEQTKGYMAGGQKFESPAGEKIYASNITPDKQTGIGTYSKNQFLKALKDGEAPKGKLHPPMPKFDKLKDSEIDAIYAYIQTIPPVDHKIEGH